MQRISSLLLATTLGGLSASPLRAETGPAEARPADTTDLDRYASPAAAHQLSAITQFSDVRPSDWAYQALANLIERHGCVAGYPDGTFRGGRILSRYEAAALLNSCLDRVTEVTDELKRLLREFEAELAVLRGRVDGLESRVGELEATQFSTTTTLSGQATFVIGSNAYGGDGTVSESVQALRDLTLARELPADNSRLSDVVAAEQGATVFNYDLRLELDTSFTGKDLLKTRLRAGNFASSPWGGFSPTNLVGLNALEVAFEEPAGADVLGVDRLYYRFGIGSNLQATIGARVRQDDMQGMWPSVYPADTILDFFTYSGAAAVYFQQVGAGGGLAWRSRGWSLSAIYLSSNGDVGAPAEGGIATEGAGSSGTVQLGYTGTGWALAAAYNYTARNQFNLYGGNATPLAARLGSLGTSNAFGISGYWIPQGTPWLPSISAGWGISTTTIPEDGGVGDVLVQAALGSNEPVVTQSWAVGLQWENVLAQGNSLGLAVGQPTFVTNDELADGDGGYAWELWYKLQATDSISLTPALFFLSRPLGALTGGDGTSLTNFGGLIKTTYRF